MSSNAPTGMQHSPSRLADAEILNVATGSAISTVTKEDAARIQSTQVSVDQLTRRRLVLTCLQTTGGHDVGKDTFASRVQSAADKNASATKAVQATGAVIMAK